MIIEIKPLDTLFFRDGKPFSMGDDTWASGMFPPFPSVLYGVLRSAYLGQNNIPLEEIKDKTKDLKIRQIWYEIEIKKGEKIKYLPQPLDLVQETELSRKQKLYAEKYFRYDAYKLAASSVDFPSHLSVLDYENILVYDDAKGGQSAKDSMLSITNYQNYLKGATQFESRRMSNYHHNEPKIGISRNNSTSTAAEGNLYRVGMLRTDSIKVLIEFEGLTLKEEFGILGIGAESKLAAYSILDDAIHKLDWNINTLDISDSKEFKICLTTPAIFGNGYYPDKSFFDKAGVKVELLTCVVGNPINVGGFDMRKREPKLMQRAVPAGSTYYYRLIDGNLEDLEEAIKEYTLSDYRGNEGFGIAFIGQA